MSSAAPRQVNREGLAIVKNGIAGMLDETGILKRSGPAPAGKPARRLTIDAKAHFIYAPCGGIFEPAFGLGDEVKAGQLAGVIHDQTDPWKTPTEVKWNGSGLVLCTRTFALCEPGTVSGIWRSEAFFSPSPASAGRGWRGPKGEPGEGQLQAQCHAATPLFKKKIIKAPHPRVVVFTSTLALMALEYGQMPWVTSTSFFASASGRPGR